MSFLGTLVHRPRKLWLRRALFHVHLWAGVLLSLYVVLIALTGSLLVFRAELTRAELPKTLNHYDPARTAAIDAVVQRFHAEYPEAQLTNLNLPSPMFPAYLLAATDARLQAFSVVADPRTATLTLQAKGWIDWVYDLHVYLLLPHAYGMQVNGAGAMILLVLCISGLVIWWRGAKTWTRGLGISVRHNWRRINFDAHSAIGFWTFALVFWWAFSGVYFGWYREVTAAVSVVSPLRGMISPKAGRSGAPGQAHVSLETMLGAIRNASLRGSLYSFSDPDLQGSTLYALVDQRAPGDFSHRDIITFSTSDARVLTVWHYGQNETAGDWVIWAMHPMHFGTLWGLGVKILWALAGVTLALLSITGVLMYWNRYLRHRLGNRG